jgi:hypothetical protein
MEKRRGVTVPEVLAMVAIVVLLSLAMIILDGLKRTAPLDVRSAIYKYGKYDVSFGKTKGLAICGCKRHLIAEDPEFKDSEEFTMGVYISGCDWEADPNHVNVRGMKGRYVPDDHEFLTWDLEKMEEVAGLVMEEESKRGNER